MIDAFVCKKSRIMKVPKTISIRSRFKNLFKPKPKINNKAKSRKRKSAGLVSIALKTAALATDMLRLRDAVIATSQIFPKGGEVSPNKFEFIIPKKTVTASFYLSDADFTDLLE